MRTISFLVLAGVLLAGEAAACDDPQAAIPARAKANLASLFSDKDYPAAAVAAREQGLVGFTLGVDPEGRVSGCTVTRSSGSAALDGATCDLIRARASFTPARDSGGAPVSDEVRGRISWVMPPAMPAPTP